MVVASHGEFRGTPDQVYLSRSPRIMRLYPNFSMIFGDPRPLFRSCSCESRERLQPGPREYASRISCLLTFVLCFAGVHFQTTRRRKPSPNATGSHTATSASTCPPSLPLSSAATLTAA